MVEHQISQIYLFVSYTLITLNCIYHIITYMRKISKEVVLVLSCSKSILGNVLQRPERLKSSYLRGKI